MTTVVKTTNTPVLTALLKAAWLQTETETKESSQLHRGRVFFYSFTPDISPLSIVEQTIWNYIRGDRRQTWNRSVLEPE